MQNQIEKTFAKGAIRQRQGGGFMLHINTGLIGFAEEWTLEELKQMAMAIDCFVNEIEGNPAIEVDFDLKPITESLIKNIEQTKQNAWVEAVGHCKINPAGTGHEYHAHTGTGPERCVWCGKWSEDIAAR